MSFVDKVNVDSTSSELGVTFNNNETSSVTCQVDTLDTLWIILSLVLYLYQVVLAFKHLRRESAATQPTPLLWIKLIVQSLAYIPLSIVLNVVFMIRVIALSYVFFYYINNMHSTRRSRRTSVVAETPTASDELQEVVIAEPVSPINIE